MDLFDTILIAIDSAGGTISGRTTIQKLVYYFKEKGLVEVNYRPYYYGPFSSDVTCTLEALVTYEFLGDIMETPDTTGYANVNPDWKRYTYRITEDGQQVVSMLKSNYRAEVEQISEIVRICNRHNQLDPNALSWAAKVHYILMQNRAITGADGVKTAASEYNWDLSESQIEQGTDLLQKLDLLPR